MSLPNPEFEKWFGLFALLAAFYFGYLLGGAA